MADASAVDRLYAESKSIVSSIPESEVSLVVSASDLLRKALVLAAASHFENKVTSAVLRYVQECSPGSNRVVSLVKMKAVSRQYHTWFAWDRPSGANQFFSLFGDEFKVMMAAKLRTQPTLQDSIGAFLEIGNERNKMVHQDFATFSFEKTLEEIYSSYQLASTFVDNLDELLRAIE